MGIAALLSGSNHYVGLDVAAFSNPERNQRILQELIPLLQERAAYTDTRWPQITDYLDAHAFPSHILTEERLREALRPERLENLRRAVSAPSIHNPITAEYRAPWSDPRVIEPGSVDLVISHSVLEHAVDLPGTYKALHQWLKPGGQPASVHLRLMREAGFTLLSQQQFTRQDGVRREELSPRWADISEEDLNCSGVYVIATK